MSMLAEPRSRQKWSQDPRNTNWSRDTTKFGYQMLTKMGWSEGKGLGQNLTGNTSHIRVNKVGSNAGIGLKKSHDDDWIAHQDDFNALLSSLNQGSSESSAKMSSLENRVKSSKKKILYKRFIKSKDLSNASSHDLACIFGKRSQSTTPVTPQISDDESKSDSDSNEPSCPINEVIDDPDTTSIKTVDSQLSIAEYFAKKMAALKQKKTMDISTVNSNTISTVDNVEEDLSVKKKKKKKRKIDEVEDSSLISDSKETENCELKKRKKETDELVLENGLVKKKKKKRTEKLETDADVELEQKPEETEVIKKKKKKKKKKHDAENTNEMES